MTDHQRPDDRPHDFDTADLDTADLDEAESPFVEDCAAMVARLHTFLDGELTDSRRVMIQAHLDLCPSCFGAFDFEAELRIVVRSRLQTAVPPSLLERVMKACRAEQAAPSGGPGAFGPGLGLGPNGGITAGPHFGPSNPLGPGSSFP